MPTAWLILMNSRLSAVLRISQMLSRKSHGGERSRGSRRLTLLAAVDELHTLAEELARHVEKFLDLVGHGDCVRKMIWGVVVQ